MLRLRAGTIVPGGHYLSLTRQEIVTISGPEGYLAGEAHETFLRLPAAVVAVGAPLLGGLFFATLPVVALAVLAGAAARTAGDLARAASNDVRVAAVPQPRA